MSSHTPEWHNNINSQMRESDEDGSTDSDQLSEYERQERAQKRARIEPRDQVADECVEEEQVPPELDDLVEMEIGEPPEPPDPLDYSAWPIQGQRWTTEEALAQFEGLYDEWFPPDLQPEDRSAHPLRFVGYDPARAAGARTHTEHYKECNKKIDRIRALTGAVTRELLRHDLMSDDDEGLRRKQRMHQVLGALYACKEIVCNSFRFVAEFIPDFNSSLDKDLQVRQFSTMIDHLPEDTNEYQQLTLFLYREAYHQDYRKSGGCCFQRVFTDDGKHFTYAWEATMTIENFVRSSTDKMLNYAQWCNRLAHKDNTGAVVKEMTDGIDEEFPELGMDRDVFSFQNGIYIGRADHFHRYTNGPAHLEDKNGVAKEPVAAKYFATDIPEEYHNLDCEYWATIETPSLEKIVNFQYFNEHDGVVFWFFVFLGRWFFDIKDFDDWQIAPLYLGMAGTGKSTILTMMKKAYPANKVATLSNNIEGKFGLAGLRDCFSWIAPDVKYNFAGNQAELQCMISGESVSVAIKHKDPRNMDWRSPGIFGANEVPKFSDNAGSMSRRLPVFQFNRMVKKQDGALDRKLDAELPFVIIKSIKAYHYALRLYGTQGIWENLPDYFHQTRGDLQETTNALVHFIRSERVECGAGLYVPMKDFKEAFNRHCDDNHFAKARWVKEYFRGPFALNGLEQPKDLRRQYPRNVPGAPMLRGVFLKGCDLKPDVVEEPPAFDEP